MLTLPYNPTGWNMMAKTKSVGTKVEPAFSQEIERLKQTFGFGSFAEMLEEVVKLLQAIDERVSQIDHHPREWSESDLLQHLSLQDPELLQLLQRRLRERFGQDGLERVRELLVTKGRKAETQSGT